MSHQLPLNLQFPDLLSFDSFYVTDENRGTVEQLRVVASGDSNSPPVLLRGARHAGKTHLLQALCHRAGAEGLAASYLPLELADKEIPCEALDGLERLDLLCLDDLQVIAGRGQWEHALVQLASRVSDSGTAMVVTSDAAPEALGLHSRGLEFRLSIFSQLFVEPLSEEDTVWALQMRASSKGVKLRENVARYLVRHYSTDLAILARTLDALDYASLAAKRRLTIPFIKSLLG